jgi:hypothetical protein
MGLVAITMEDGIAGELKIVMYIMMGRSTGKVKDVTCTG